MRSILKRILSPDQLCIDLKYVKLDYKKAPKADVLKVVHQFRKRGALIDDINDELWFFTFKSLSELRDLIADLLSSLTHQSDDLKQGILQIDSALKEFLRKYRNDYLRFHDNPTPETYRPQKDWDWPNLGDAARDLYLTRNLICVILDAIQEDLEDDIKYKPTRPNRDGAEAMIKSSEIKKYRDRCNVKIIFKINGSEHPDSNADIYIVGDFNNWDPVHDKVDFLGIVAYPTVRFGFFTNLPPGTYRYKLVQGQRWFTDPNNDQVETDEKGNENSVLIVKS